jgi:predicted ATP-dependent serine protease
MVRAATRVAVLGRGREQEHVAQFLGEIPRGPAILLIEGEAGIGKTTLWGFGVEEALDRGHTVLVARAGETETKLRARTIRRARDPVG